MIQTTEVAFKIYSTWGAVCVLVLVLLLLEKTKKKTPKKQLCYICRYFSELYLLLSF